MSESNKNYPEEYSAARGRFNRPFLELFDSHIFETSPVVSLVPSKTANGNIYAYFSVATAGLVPLALAAHNLVSLSQQSHNLNYYKNLVTISYDARRCTLCESPECLALWKEGILEIEDLGNCPIDTLSVLLQPANIATLRLNAKEIQAQKGEVTNCISSLEQELKICGEQAPEASALKAKIAAEREKLVPILGRLRRANYAPHMLAFLLTEFPMGYYQARSQLPQSILNVFDKMINKHAESSDISSHASFLLWTISSSDSEQEKVRQSHYNDLITIANDKQRLNLARSFRDLYDNEIIQLRDLARCPIDVIKEIFKPENVIILRANFQEVTAPPQQKSQTLIMAHLRTHNYDSTWISYLLTARSKRYRFLCNEYDEHLNRLHEKVKDLEQSHKKKSRAFYDVANTLYTELFNIKNRLLVVLQENKTPQEIKDIISKFHKFVNDAITIARPVLEQDRTYNWDDLLTDIANAFALIGTVGLSYAITGRFRLFELECDDLAARGKKIVEEATIIQQNCITELTLN